MPPLHHKGMAGTEGPPEPDDPRNRSPEKEPAHRRPDRTAARTGTADAGAGAPSPGIPELRIMVLWPRPGMIGGESR
jgi:hypothetical protein